MLIETVILDYRKLKILNGWINFWLIIQIKAKISVRLILIANYVNYSWFVKQMLTAYIVILAKTSYISYLWSLWGYWKINK